MIHAKNIIFWDFRFFHIFFHAFCKNASTKLAQSASNKGFTLFFQAFAPKIIEKKKKNMTNRKNNIFRADHFIIRVCSQQMIEKYWFLLYETSNTEYSHFWTFWVRLKLWIRQIPANTSDFLLSTIFNRLVLEAQAELDKKCGHYEYLLLEIRPFPGSFDF